MMTCDMEPAPAKSMAGVEHGFIHKVKTISKGRPARKDNIYLETIVGCTFSNLLKRQKILN